MIRLSLSARLLALAVFAVSLSACQRNEPAPAPTVINVPGPAGATGATGATGSTGSTGSTGEAGKPGDGTTVIVVPPAPASAPS